MGPEWCYQWPNPDEYLERYYKSKSKNVTECTSQALKEDLWKGQPVVEVDTSKKERPFQKKADAKDAFYFSDL